VERVVYGLPSVHILSERWYIDGDSSNHSRGKKKKKKKKKKRRRKRE